MRLVIKGELPDLNTEINAAKQHWAIYASHKRQWTQYIAAQIRTQNLGQISAPIMPIFFWFTKNE